MIEIQIEKGIPMPPPPQPRPEGACVCGTMPRDGYKTCDACLEAVKRIRLAQKAKGLCQSGCCKELPADGHTMCERHLDYLRVTAKLRQEKRKDEGVCVDCGVRPGWWGVRCVLCRSNYVKSPLTGGARAALKRHRRFEKIDARRAQAETLISFITDERVRRIFIARHGLQDGIDRTLEEIGAQFAVTRERIRQIERSTLDELAFAGVDVSLMRPPFGAVQRPPIVKRRYLTSPETRKKALAHRLVSLALEDGTLKRQSCEVKGCLRKKQKAIAHHHDYDKPLEVQWLCLSHHMQAHGRGTGEPKPKGTNWLDKINPSREHYDAAAIIAAIKDGLYRPRIKAIKEATGLNYRQVKAVLSGKRVNNEVLITMLRYVESLKQQAA